MFSWRNTTQEGHHVGSGASAAKKICEAPSPAKQGEAKDKAVAADSSRPLTKEQQIAKLYNELSWLEKEMLPKSITVDSFELSPCGKKLYLKEPTCICGEGCPPELGFFCGGDCDSEEW